MTDISSIHEQLSKLGFLTYMAPALSGSEVTRIEREYNISLPLEYREFLMRIGNGGPGPYYGIIPIEKALDYDKKLWGDLCPKDHLMHPFVHVAAYNPDEVIERINERADSGEIDDGEHSRLVFELYRGGIGLSHHGCGYYDILVVTGPTRGQVWHDATGNGFNFSPIGIGFIAWYQSWLNGEIATMWKPEDFLSWGLLDKTTPTDLRA